MLKMIILALCTKRGCRMTCHDFLTSKYESFIERIEPEISALSFLLPYSQSDCGYKNCLTIDKKHNNKDIQSETKSQNRYIIEENKNMLCSLLRNTGISSSECLMITHSDEMITASHESGICCIHYSEPYNEDICHNYEAAMVIEGFDEIDYSFLLNIWKRSHGLPLTITCTERLILKELSTDDFFDLYNIYNDKRISSHIQEMTGTPEEEVMLFKEYIRCQYGFFGFGYWGVYLKNSGKLIGRCGIEMKEINEKSCLELGYVIAADYQKRGYASEASKAVLKYVFDNYESETVAAVIQNDNTASIKVAQKIGLTFKGEINRNGKLCYLYQTE